MGGEILGDTEKKEKETFVIIGILTTIYFVQLEPLSNHQKFIRGNDKSDRKTEKINKKD